MPDWVGWMIAAGVLGAGEIVTPGMFVLGPLAVAAFGGGAVGLGGGPIELQVLTFAGGSILSLGVLRPVARRHLHMPGQTRTGAAALVGATALVLERIDADSGQVKLGGEVWTARSYDGEDVIEAGDRVTVLEIKGATALVAR